MKKSVLIISGWAHRIEAIRPMGDALADAFDVRLTTGAEVLRNRALPAADFIVTGSMGGLLALEHLPDECEKLVLVSSTARFCSAEDFPHGTHPKILRRMIAALKRNPEAVLADFYANTHHPFPPLKTDPEAELDELVAGLEYLLETDLRDRISDIQIPVLLLHGEQDRIIPAGAARWLNEGLPNSELTLFADDGHALLAHHFSDAMAAIRAFLLNDEYVPRT